MLLWEVFKKQRENVNVKVVKVFNMSREMCYVYSYGLEEKYITESGFCLFFVVS